MIGKLRFGRCPSYYQLTLSVISERVESMSRQDISDYLIHFTKDMNLEMAFKRFQKILRDHFLLGGNRCIKGGYTCVCFSEAPLTSLSTGLINSRYYSSYSPFGIMMPKTYIYALGGRPVIYQSDCEFGNLPESLRWRHVRYEPPKIDFSWEREWRIKIDYLPFDEGSVSLVLPDLMWANRLKTEHEFEQDYTIMQYSTIFSQSVALSFYQPFNWKIFTLS